MKVWALSSLVPTSAPDGFSPIPEILDELRAGRMVVLTDDEDRENEGDFVAAAEKATPEMVNFMLTHGRGMMCVALDGPTCDRLQLEPLAKLNTSEPPAIVPRLERAFETHQALLLAKQDDA